MTAALRAWGIGLALVAALVAAARWAARPPTPPAAPAPTAFSTARAAATLRRLAGELGPRPMGSPTARAAAAFLEGELRAVAGLEVDVQDQTGTAAYDGEVFAYRARNVVARLPGQTREALLVSAHYDSLSEAPGAADNGVAVAAVLEVARAAAAGPRPHATLIFLFDDGEEWGLLGASAFTHHRWFPDVRAVINLDAAGAGGKAALFQSADRRLLDAYARAAPYPWASVIGQDLFVHGLIPSDTNFHVFRDAGLGGIDLALYEDGWSYHTPLDGLARVEPGSLEQVGANTLAVVRAARLDDDAAAVDRSPAVYYDLLGLALVRYGAATGRGLAGAALGLVLLVLYSTRRTLRARAILAGAAVLGAAVLAGLLAALAGALVVGALLGRPMSFYARPAPTELGLAALALAGALGPLGAWARRREVDQAAAALAAGGAISWALGAALGALGGVGAAYLAWWWAVGAALGLLVSNRWPARRGTAALLALGPGALVTIDQAERLLALAVPLTGRLALPFPPGLVVAVLVALPALGCLVGAAPAIVRAGSLGRVAAALFGVGALALAVGASQPPYTRDRPLRLVLAHRIVEGERSDRLLAIGFDPAGVRRALAAQPGLTAASDGFARFELTTPAAPLAPPTVGAHPTAAGADGVRTVSLRVSGPGYGLRLGVPRDALVGWSLGDLPALGPRATEYHATRLGDPDAPWEVTLRLRGAPAAIKIGVFAAGGGLAPGLLPVAVPDWCVVAFRSSMTRVERW